MKRTHRYVAAAGTVSCTIDGGEVIDVPVFGGILKHPDLDQLRELLRDPVVVRKYTHEALRRAPWSALQQFPRSWLLARLADAKLPAPRRHALDFMLGVSLPSDPS